MTNDLAGDSRVHRVCLTLTEMGFSVLLVGRKLPSSPFLPPRTYATRRMKLLFKKGPLFYACYNLRLLIFLLFRRFDLLLANDLDTLPANRLAGWLKRKPVVYDSHEYFTEVPELVGRPRVRKAWAWVERRLVPGVTAAWTVSESIAAVYSRQYRVPFAVVRNLPLAWHPPSWPASLSGQEAETAEGDRARREPPLTGRVGKITAEAGSRPVILYQGALNLGRGLDKAITAMQYLPGALLLLAGSGDLEEQLKSQICNLRIANVRLLGRIPPEELALLTRRARLGISVEEDRGLSYRYALPNKLFDYIQARIPVVVSPLPEMSRVVLGYGIGLVTPSLEPEILAETFRKALEDETLRRQWAVNLERAAGELTWERESEKIREIFGPYLD